MAIADLIGTELTGHQFAATMHWHATDTSGTMTNALAVSIVETILGRALTAPEQTQLLAISTDISGGSYSASDLERAQVLVEQELITNAQAKALLGL